MSRWNSWRRQTLLLSSSPLGRNKFWSSTPLFILPSHLLHLIPSFLSCISVSVLHYEIWFPGLQFMDMLTFTDTNNGTTNGIMCLRHIFFKLNIFFYCPAVISLSHPIPPSCFTRSITHTDPFILCLARRLPALQVESSSPVSSCLDLPPPSDCPDPSHFPWELSIGNKLLSGFSRGEN